MPVPFPLARLGDSCIRDASGGYSVPYRGITNKIPGRGGGQLVTHVDMLRLHDESSGALCLSLVWSTAMSSQAGSPACYPCTHPGCQQVSIAIIEVILQDQELTIRDFEGVTISGGMRRYVSNTRFARTASLYPLIARL